jgi:WS/DGAT/MGAT family acyltransferase
MRGPWRPASPFNLVPLPVLDRVPLLVEVDRIDVDEHVFLHTLPGPGGQRQLGELVARLHGELLPRDRPLWQMHLVDGLEGDRFAVYTKVHHALIDGVSGMRRLVRWLSPDPDARDLFPPFTVGPGDRPRTRPPASLLDRAARTAVLPARAAATAVGVAAGAALGAVQVGGFLAESARGEIDGEPLAGPYRVPPELFRGEITHERRIAIHQLPLGRVKAAAKASSGTVNDVVLWLVSTALRDYLPRYLTLPDESLMAGCAVNLRAPDDNRFGSSFGFLSVDLATDEPDDLERLARIHRSSATAKRQLSRLGPPALALQGVLAQSPLVGGLLLGLGDRTPAAYAVAVSNVPGPREQLYLEGARLDALVPVSIPVDSNPLNVTCVSHADVLTFGITAAAATVPRVQKLGEALADAWPVLCAALGVDPS